MRVDDPDPPEERVTLVGLTDVDRPDGETEANRLTVPVKPLRLVRLITDVPEVPDWMVRLDGLLDMLKSVGGGLTVTSFDVVPVCDAESVTVRRTVKLPDVVYVCVTVLPVPVTPSPKFQANEYGDVPPDADPVKVTACPTVGDDGLNVKLGVGVATCILQPVKGCNSHPEKEWSCAEQQLGPSQYTKPWKSMIVEAAVV